MKDLQKQIDNYLDDCRFLKGLSGKTIKAYDIDLRQYWKFCINSDWLEKTTLENYIKKLYSEFKPKSAKRKVACLKAFFHYLESEDLIESSPFHKIKIKRREALILPKTIPVSTISKMLNKVYQMSENESKSEVFRKKAVRDAAAMELMFATGVRVCELCMLVPDDIDLKNKMIKVHGKRKFFIRV